ncbi:flagellar hook-associated protein FlgK [Helicobacter winghamensis]|uniref:Flagellar hook-associated protein 1 n=1 Tax=Helicobacter winghamensis TaxID=157268 RepID=A0A2N3PIU5_9HELI|nr:flagellar hook-associated protein FlgK [Helicobacter winghamensis]EEO25301.1 flagellar hook-associated protein FlgK [Helicobacter winghamensis ATCC BAA-430]PKT76342.1 flagellar hook-associated protein FlgK [Helicobacter winghamensis]PKT76473.1 flagellar hook-associated protein FlgK [Helicobacter winghamensis]PKT76604.1 flagellar hook-associated protein FlgK [Helicobacter winghamensis]PKT80853.1 flagellar hook-associated protein FlgK [Helicobacter winghamensis]
MGGLLSSLNTPYTGLTGHQVMVDVTGNNIANANNEFYSRQVVRSSAQTPLWKQNYALGQGLNILTVERVHDEYSFMRYKKASSEKTFYDTSFSGLKEASAYYPEVDGVGIYKDLQSYFNAWKDLSTKAGDPAQKIALAEQAKTLTKNIQETRKSLEYLQQRLNDEMKVAVDEVNRLGEQIAILNKQIAEYENQDMNKKANDLRDLRDQYEFEINNLIGCDVFKQNVQGSACVDKDIADFDDDYTLTIGGKSIVDGTSFHPLVLDNSENPSGIYTIKYLRSDHKPYDLTNSLNQGKVGALLDLIRTEDVLNCNGTLGKLQVYINDLDTFANGIIEATNNIYAESSQRSAKSDQLTLDARDALTTSGYNVREGTFKVVMYDKDGKELGAREVTINNLTTMQDIVNQLNGNVDDNKDGNPLNDFDDRFQAVYNNDSKTFSITSKNPAEDIFISIQDNGTNFAGAFGVNRFFDGNDASNIELAQQYREDPTLIRAYREAVDGNFVIANKMQQLQFDKITFTDYKGEQREETISGYFRYIAGKVASETQATQTTQSTKEAVYSATKQEYKALCEVSVDDELVNLIRFQSGYSANAKMITTIDEMINTLLGIKS